MLGAHLENKGGSLLLTRSKKGYPAEMRWLNLFPKIVERLDGE